MIQAQGPTVMDGIRNNKQPSLNSGEQHRVRRYGWLLFIFWTLAVALSLTWNLHMYQKTTLEMARAQARTSFEKDVLYRRWNAKAGGVYLPVSEQTPPNPYLDVEDKVITTPSGRKLTLVNPAYMTRQVHEMQNIASGIRGHITSLNPIRPQDKPDPWERMALLQFEAGQQEVSSVEWLDGQKHMRLMRPLYTEQVCLKCHAKHGYKVGDISGGISISIPMAPLDRIAWEHVAVMSAGYGGLWIVGLLGLAFGRNRLNKSMALHRLADKALQEKSAYLDSILSSSTDMSIISMDTNLCITYFNQAAEQVFGYRAKDIIGRTASQLHELKDVDPAWFDEAIRIVHEQGKYHHSIVLDVNGTKRHIDSTLSAIRDNRHELIGYVLMARDVTEQKRSERIIEHQASYDALTDLPNRRNLIDRLSRAISRDRRHNRIGAALFIDLDYFKIVNDSYGHGVGDTLLQNVAKRLLACLRTEDTAARLSGDEFVVLLSELGNDADSAHEYALAVAEKVREALQQTNHIGEYSIHITATVGVTLFPLDDDGPEDVLNRADHAMYNAKQAGRDTVRVDTRKPGDDRE